MKDKLMKLSVKLQVGFAATAGMKTLATDINTAFGNMGSTLNSYVT